jgi:hypothetical protein
LDEEIEAVAVGELGLSRASAALASKKVRTMLVPVCGEGDLPAMLPAKRGDATYRYVKLYVRLPTQTNEIIGKMRSYEKI